MKNRFALIVSVLSVCLLTAGCEWSAYRDAVRSNSEEGYKEFLAEHPDGKYHNDVRRRWHDLALNQAAQENTIAGFREFVAKFPDSAKAEEVRNLIREMVQDRLQPVPPEKLSQIQLAFHTSQGSFTIGLFGEDAPGHARNMIVLAESDFFDGQSVGQVKAGQFVRMGDPGRTGRGGPGYLIPAEINDRKHVRGMVTMYHPAYDKNAAGSQFIVILDQFPMMDGQFTVFGQVVEGLDVVQAISEIPNTGDKTDPPFRPVQEVTIADVEVKGIDFE